MVQPSFIELPGDRVLWRAQVIYDRGQRQHLSLAAAGASRAGSHAQTQGRCLCGLAIARSTLRSLAETFAAITRCRLRLLVRSDRTRPAPAPVEFQCGTVFHPCPRTPSKAAWRRLVRRLRVLWRARFARRALPDRVPSETSNGSWGLRPGPLPTD